MEPEGEIPIGVWAAAGFFAVAGVLEITLALVEMPPPRPFWPMWEALGRGLLHFLAAAGLWRRLAVCRSLAMVYCLAAIVTYAAALALAYARAPFRFPTSLVVQSIFEVPSCLLLFPFLRSLRGAVLFPRPLWPR